MAAKRSASGSRSSKRNGSTTAKNGSTPKSGDGFKTLKDAHRHIRDLCKPIETFEVSEASLDSLREVCLAWMRHALLEREVAFPKFRAAGVEEASLAAAAIEADLVLMLLADIVQRDSEDEIFVAVVRTALRAMARLIELEEREPDGLFAEARKAGVDATALESDLAAHLAEIERQAEDQSLSLRPRHLRGAGSTHRPMEMDQMPGYGRERDERGRFVEEDDDRRGGSRSGSRASSSRSRYDDDDERRESRSSGRGGRYDEDDDRGYRSRSRNDDDDDRGYRGRSSGGGRRGYEDDERQYRSRSASYDGDDRRRSGRDHGQGGWFGDSEGHSQASRRGWENSDHGRSGWYGDSEGHSQASRRGWESSDHGESGWFGDPEGHSEASRRGWEGRRRDDRDDDSGRRRRR